MSAALRAVGNIVTGDDVQTQVNDPEWGTPSSIHLVFGEMFEFQLVYLSLVFLWFLSISRGGGISRG